MPVPVPVPVAVTGSGTGRADSVDSTSTAVGWATGDAGAGESGGGDAGAGDCGAGDSGAGGIAARVATGGVVSCGVASAAVVATDGECWAQLRCQGEVVGASAGADRTKVGTTAAGLCSPTAGSCCAAVALGPPLGPASARSLDGATSA